LGDFLNKGLKAVAQHARTGTSAQKHRCTILEQTSLAAGHQYNSIARNSGKPLFFLNWHGECFTATQRRFSIRRRFVTTGYLSTRVPGDKK
jgi:hypothetical protein